MIALVERLAALEAKFERLIDLQLENNRLLAEKQEAATKPYLDHEDMRRLFGWEKTNSAAHKKRLAFLRRNGHLSNFGSLKPYTYERKQAETVAAKYQAGLILIPIGF